MVKCSLLWHQKLAGMWVWLILCNAHRLQCEGCLTSRGMGLWRHCGRALTGPRVPPCRRKIGQKTVSDKWRSSLSGSFPDCPYGHCKLIRNEYQYWKIPSCQSICVNDIQEQTKLICVEASMLVESITSAEPWRLVLSSSYTRRVMSPSRSSPERLTCRKVLFCAAYKGLSSRTIQPLNALSW